MINKIESLLSRNYFDIDEELQSHLLNYICILKSAFLEIEITNILSGYKNSTHCNLHECKDNIKAIGKIQNAKWCSIRPVLLNIDEKILKKLKEKFANNFDEITSSIDSIVKTRHKIAHGENVTTLTIEFLRKNFANIKRFIEVLKKIILNL